MFDLKNVKPKTLVFLGVVSSIVLVIVGVGIFLLLKSKNKESPVTHVGPKTIPAGAKEVYLQSLNGGITVAAGKFEGMKAKIFPSNPNISLATVDEIGKAIAKGLKVCAAGLALDDMGKEIQLLITPGPDSDSGLPPDSKPMCTEMQRFEVLEEPSFNIWVYGVKPSNGTEDAKGVLPFSLGRWSMYNALPGR